MLFMLPPLSATPYCPASPNTFETSQAQFFNANPHYRSQALRLRRRGRRFEGTEKHPAVHEEERASIGYGSDRATPSHTSPGLYQTPLP